MHVFVYVSLDEVYRSVYHYLTAALSLMKMSLGEARCVCICMYVCMYVCNMHVYIYVKYPCTCVCIAIDRFTTT
jgi:hypothetical protein